jgi:hypothetical protein
VFSSLAEDFAKPTRDEMLSPDLRLLHRDNKFLLVLEDLSFDLRAFESGRRPDAGGLYYLADEVTRLTHNKNM